MNTYKRSSINFLRVVIQKNITNFYLDSCNLTLRLAKETLIRENEEALKREKETLSREKEAIARSFLKSGISIEIVAQNTRLTIDELRKLQNG